MKTIEITCPNCGRKHNVQTTKYETLHLNGMPNMSMKNFTNMMVVCQCGLLVTPKEWNGINTLKMLHSPEYQECLNAAYESEVEKKLALLNALYHFPQMSMYYACYYDETNNQEKRQSSLQQAIQRILNGQDTQTYLVDGIPLYNITDTLGLFLTSQRRLIDLYRCTGQFEKAQEQIKSLKHDSNADAYKQYLSIEKQLIRDKNTKFI
jgi:hypothetical protein